MNQEIEIQHGTKEKEDLEIMEIKSNDDVNAIDENLVSKKEENIPPDIRWEAYGIFSLLGCGILIPWISVLTAADYFIYIYDGYNFAFNISVAYLIPLSFTMLLIAYQGSKLSFNFRIIFGFILFTGFFILIPLVSLIPNRAIGFGLTLFLMCLIAISDATIQGTLYGLSAIFPPVYIQAIQGGNGMAGVITSIARILTKLSLPDTPDGLQTSSMIYFGFSIAFLLCCICGYLRLLQLPITKYCISKQVNLFNKPNRSTHNPANILTSVSKKTIIFDKHIFLSIKLFFISISLNFAITLFIYPGMIVNIPSTFDGTWFPVILISIFNIADFIGKLFPRFLGCFPSKIILWLVLGRIFFFPLFLLCLKPRIFSLDIFPILFMIIFALSNGYLGSSLMMHAPDSVRPIEREIAGSLMAFGLVGGLAVGALFAWFLPYIL